MSSPLQIEQALNNVRDQKDFIQKLLVGALNWPVPNCVEQLDEIAYDWTAGELRAAELEEKVVGGKAFQIQLQHAQSWGIFVLEFQDPKAVMSGRGVTVPLRKVLRGLVNQRRAHLPAFARPNLLFICTHGYRDYRFAYFKSPAEGSRFAPLATFGWEENNPARRTVCDYNLPELAWPGSGVSAADWTARWAKAFDIEAVTKAFFDQYRCVFEKVGGLIEGIDNKETSRLFRQRLFNRLMFIAFIQKKGWMKIDEMQHNNYLQALWERHQSNKKPDGNFYNERLRALFFYALNTPTHVNLTRLGKEKFSGRKSLLERIVGEVRYLNGGLFEKSDDGTDNDDRIRKIVVPDKTIDVILHDLFARFNFTVAENTRSDIEVAVDPEMLGKVFEELVTGRHESGSYYTPKPIVSFMCREALKGYLQTKLPGESAIAIAALVDDHDPSSLKNSEAVLAGLCEVRVCDPACGSGAYLLGMMHELLDLRACLFASNDKLDAKSAYHRKLEIIQTNLYGVDIDPFAVNIARLRLWLSLAVEFDGPEPEPLPNLDFKIEVGDSLTAPDPSGAGQLALHRGLVEQFAARKGDYLRAHHTDKKDLRIEIDVLRVKLQKWAAARGDVSGFDWAVEFAEVFFGEVHETTMDGRFGFAADADKQLGLKMAEQTKPGGFDIVLANPPYVRQELITERKSALRAAFPEVYAGAADLCCYFFCRAVQLLRPGGMLVFIASNKWMRAGYGRGLRSFLFRHTVPKGIVDFGHAPIFPETDTFPCIPIFAKRTRPLANGERPPEAETFVACTFPRDDYRRDTEIGAYVASHSKTIPTAYLRDDCWTLDDPRIQLLLERIRNTGVPLKQFCNGPLYRGPVTGLNDAFFIDAAARKQLILEDKRSAEVIKPLLRGRDVDRWRPRRSDTFIIFTRRGIDIAAYPAIKRHLSQYRSALEERAGEQAWYELQASPSDDFARAMFRPKIIYQEIQFHSWFSLETEGACVNNKVFMLPTDDLALLGVLSSPLMWWFLTRTLPHMKDEALCPAGFLMENIRVTTGTREQAAGIRKVVKQLIGLADALHQWQDEFSSEACRTVGADEADPRIISWVPLSSDVFNSRLAKLAGHKRMPVGLAAKTTSLHARGQTHLLGLLKSQIGFEQQLATLVEDVFGLTAEERELLRTTKPVRDPLDVLNMKIAGRFHDESATA